MGKEATPSRIHVLFFPPRFSERIDYCILFVPHSCIFAHCCDCPEHLIYECDFVLNPSEPTASSIFKHHQPPSVNYHPIFLKVFHIYHSYSNQVACSGNHIIIGNGACDINHNSQHTLQQDNQVPSHIDPQMPPPPLWTSLALRDHVTTHPIVDSYLPEVQTPPFHPRPFPIGNMDYIYEHQHSNKLHSTTHNPALRLSQTRHCDDHSFKLLNGLFGQEPRDSHDLGNGLSTEAQFFNQLLIKLINTLDIEPALQENDIHDGSVHRQESFIKPEEIRRSNHSQDLLSPVLFNHSEFDRGDHNRKIIHVYPDFNLDFDGQYDETSGLYKDCIDDEIMDTSPQLSSLPTDRNMENTGYPHLQRPANPVARVLERGGSEHMVPIITDGNPMNGNINNPMNGNINNHTNND